MSSDFDLGVSSTVLCVSVEAPEDDLFLFSVRSEKTELERMLLFIRFRVFKILWLVQLPTGTLFRHGVVLVICFCFCFCKHVLLFSQIFCYGECYFILVFFFGGWGGVGFIPYDNIKFWIIINIDAF